MRIRDSAADRVCAGVAARVSWELAGIKGIGWGWTGVIWLYNIVVYLLLDPIKFAVRYGLSGKAWNLVIESTTRWPSRTARTLARRPGRRRGRTSSARCMGWRAPGESGVGGAGADGGGRPVACGDHQAAGAAHQVESVVKLKGLDLKGRWW